MRSRQNTCRESRFRFRAGLNSEFFPSLSGAEARILSGTNSVSGKNVHTSAVKTHHAVQVLYPFAIAYDCYS